MLENKILTEKYKIIDGKVYAVFEETGEKRELNGCEVRVELSKDNAGLESHKANLEQMLEDVNKKLKENYELDGKLAALGYCKKDQPVYTKTIEGLVLKDKDGKPKIRGYTHQRTCAHKEGL